VTGDGRQVSFTCFRISIWKDAKMGLTFTRLRGRFHPAVMPLILGAALLALFSLPAPAAGPALVIRSDRGGLMEARSNQIRQLRATGQRVELRGICYSSCTMYLGLPNVCVAPTAKFGFHGPSWYGAALEPPDFEYWSQLMARSYREPLRSWFLRTGRHRTSGYYRMNGTDLIRMGYSRC
jgi:hypothetical protein